MPDSDIAEVAVSDIPEDQASPDVTTEAIASEPEDPNDLRAQLEAANRKAATFEGLTKSLRQREAELSQQVSQLSANTQQLLDRLGALEGRTRQDALNHQLASLQAQGYTQEELARYKSLAEQEARLEREKEDLRRMLPEVAQTKADAERQRYIGYVLSESNKDLAEAGVKTPITWEELAASFKKPPAYQGEVDEALRKIVIKRMTQASQGARKQALATRAAEGVDKMGGEGTSGVTSIAQAEALWVAGKIPKSEYFKAVQRARADGLISY